MWTTDFQRCAFLVRHDSRFRSCRGVCVCVSVLGFANCQVAWYFFNCFHSSSQCVAFLQEVVFVCFCIGLFFSEAVSLWRACNCDIDCAFCLTRVP